MCKGPRGFRTLASVCLSAGRHARAGGGAVAARTGRGFEERDVGDGRDHVVDFTHGADVARPPLTLGCRRLRRLDRRWTGWWPGVSLGALNLKAAAPRGDCRPCAAGQRVGMGGLVVVRATHVRQRTAGRLRSEMAGRLRSEMGGAWEISGGVG